MKASLKTLIFGLFLLAPLSTAHAQGPALSPIANVSLNAGSTLNVNVIAVDVDGRPITVTAALPPFATLNTPTVGTEVVVTSLTLTPSDAHVGDYSAAVTATAGGVSSVRVFQITVNAAGADRAPVVIAPPLQSVIAGSALSFVVTASDADGNAITSLSASGLPSGATFTPNGSNTAATFAWTPNDKNTGEYDVLFTAANALSGTSVTHVRVAPAPTLAITPIDDVTVEGGATRSVPVHASGVPGALITLTASLPSFAILDPPGSGTGAVNTTVTVAPPTGSAGTYHASITAISQGTSVTELFDIIVTGDGGGENHAPVLTAPATATVEVGSTLSFGVTASDPDGDHVDLIGSALPPGSGFVDHADDTGTFTWTPVLGQAGTYTASFTGLDGRGGSGSASTLITVTGGGDENGAPTLSAPQAVQVDEGEALSFTVTATDPDGDDVAISASALPSGATFTDHGDNTGTFSWTPGASQSGTYEVAFLGNDGNGGTGTASTSIMVMDDDPGGENHAPTLSAPSTLKVDEGEALAFTVTASDPDGDHVAISASALPSGATFTDHGDDTGTFSWTPGASQSGTYEVGFLGNDGNGGTDAASTIITVTDVDGGGEVPGRACVINKFLPHRDVNCFRINPVDDSFDLRDVVLSGIRFRFNGETVAALDRAEIELHCHGRGGQGDPGDENGPGNDDGDDDDGAGDPCGVSCKIHPPHDHDDRGGRGGTCDTLGIRVCFSSEALLRLMAGGTTTPGNSDWKRLQCALVDAQILATLTSGATVVATFGEGDHDDDGKDDDDDDDEDQGKDDDKGNGNGNDNGKGNDNGNDKGNDKGNGKGNDDADEQDGKGKSGHEEIQSVTARPNPLSPSTELSFTMAGDGRVRVVVYDMQGRLVKTLLDDIRTAGTQTLAWDGTNESNLRVPRGVYFLRIQGSAGSVTHRVSVVK